VRSAARACPSIAVATFAAHPASAVITATRLSELCAEISLCVLPCSNIDGVATWHPLVVVRASRLAVAYGPAAIVVLVRWLRCCLRICLIAHDALGLQCLLGPFNVPFNQWWRK
jgi:hypothetical protein